MKTIAGTTGMRTDWGGAVVAVCADWVHASAPVYIWSDADQAWEENGHQVSDYRHSDLVALADELEEWANSPGQVGPDEDGEDLINDALGSAEPIGEY